MKDVLKATVHSIQFKDCVKKLTRIDKDKISFCINDVENPAFFKDVYFILRAVYPALRALRYCDSNMPMMDKIYYLSYRASETLRKSVDDIDANVTDVDDELHEFDGEVRRSLEEMTTKKLV